jgi:hypothetical protein
LMLRQSCNEMESAVPRTENLAAWGAYNFCGLSERLTLYEPDLFADLFAPSDVSNPG